MAITKTATRKSTIKKFPVPININDFKTEISRAYVPNPSAKKSYKVKRGFMEVDVLYVDTSESESNSESELEPTYTPSSSVPQANFATEENPSPDDSISLEDLELKAHLSPHPVHEPAFHHGSRGDPHSDDSGYLIHSPPWVLVTKLFVLVGINLSYISFP